MTHVVVNDRLGHWWRGAVVAARVAPPVGAHTSDKVVSYAPTRAVKSAKTAYRRAIGLEPDEAVRRFLSKQLDKLS